MRESHAKSVRVGMSAIHTHIHERRAIPFHVQTYRTKHDPIYHVALVAAS